ncbi:hypothetical protein OEZ86_008971 [Tetradesmus obliquus]|nr:hypothetical protein OEZ86_008971 [Tetradesmus obliquus]
MRWPLCFAKCLAAVADSTVHTWSCRIESSSSSSSSSSSGCWQGHWREESSTQGVVLRSAGGAVQGRL